MPYKPASVVIAIILVAAADAAHALPRACQAVTPAQLAQHGLRASDRGVLFSPAEFFFDYQMHPFEVFSDAALDPHATGRMCIRYEIANTGPNVIHHLHWDRIIDRNNSIALLPTRRMSRRTKLTTNISTPVKARSYLQAFYNSYADVEVWDVVPMFGHLHTSPESGSTGDQSAPDPVSAHTEGNVITIYPDDVSTALATTLLEMDIEHRPALAFFAADVFMAHPIEDIILTTEHSITIDSSAAVRHGAATIEITIEVNETSAQDISLSSSVLSATESADDIEEFLNLLQRNRDEPIWYSGSKYHMSRTYTIEDHADQAWTYMVNFPITIIFDDQAVCFRTFAYSPFPISVSEEFCEIK